MNESQVHDKKSYSFNNHGICKHMCIEDIFYIETLYHGADKIIYLEGLEEEPPYK